jgi:N-acetyl-1-D-myo-inositol-2-amino-2-deoxy-alpha-D-glucopyranoside deacetylase
VPILSSAEESPRRSGERVLFVHAHPDDETIATGATIATLVDAGAVVTVLTCTRGELGEVIPPQLSHLAGDEAGLAAWRSGELEQAMRVLGVSDHRFLGEPDARWAGREPRRYLDSGMRWERDGDAGPLPSIGRQSLCAAPLEEVVSDIAAVIAHVQPDAVVSYDESGGYGHPDHVRAHLASRRAAEAMDVPFFAIEPARSTRPVAVSVDAAAMLERKRQALLAYRTQVVVDGDRYSLSSGPARPIASRERFSALPLQRTQPTPWRDQGRGLKAAGCALALVTGLALGALATVNHQVALTWFGASVGVGVVISLALVAALLAGLRLAYGGRILPAFAAVGVLLAAGTLSIMGAGGSVLVPANLTGWIWTFGAPVVAVAVLGWPSIRGSGSRRASRETALPYPASRR